MEMMNSLGRWCKNRALGLLFIRIAIGMVFIAHGWMKVGNMAGTEAFFASLGLPAFAAVFVAWLEVIGGVALILGVLPRVFAALFAIEMIVAIYAMGAFSRGYGVHEMELVLLLGSLGIVLAGSGRWSLWAGECHHCGAMKCTDPNCPKK